MPLSPVTVHDEGMPDPPLAVTAITNAPAL